MVLELDNPKISEGTTIIVRLPGNEGVLVTKLATELLEPTNGDLLPTNYFSLLIIGKGYDLNDIKVASQLTTVIRIQDLVTNFEKGCKLLNKTKNKMAIIILSGIIKNLSYQPFRQNGLNVCNGRFYILKLPGHKIL